MRWLLAGLLFALAVALAVGTAGIRAENSLRRHAAERQFRAIQDRKIELDRLSVQLLEAASPERLAAAQWELLRGELARRQGALQ